MSGPAAPSPGGAAALPGDISADALAQIRHLPADILAGLPALIVNRQGDDPQAFMRTENIIGHAAPGQSYILTLNGLQAATQAGSDSEPCTDIDVPAHAVVQGNWNKAVELTTRDANILGGMGTFRLPPGQDALAIPASTATRQRLAFYRSSLVAVGEAVCFECAENLPVTVTAVGATYVDRYLMDPDKGGGTYLEIHDRPHFHMPLDEEAHGHMILGKTDTEGRFLLSAFRIPFGFAIKTAPDIVHNDAHLVGRFIVIYSTTEDFSTVIVRRHDGALAPIIFTADGDASMS